MVAIRANAVDGYVKKPASDKPLILVYGPDTGLVAERASALFDHFRGDNEDVFASLKIDGSDLAGEPSRLADEAQTISLFGGKRTIWVRARDARLSVAPFEALLERAPTDAVVIIEAGDLKKSSPVRKRIEACAHGAALACYADDATSLNRLINDVVSAHGCTIEADARAMLVHTLGSDRLASRAEIEKLCLYAGPGCAISAGDVRAATAHSAALIISDFVDASAAGEVANADALCRRLLAGGTNENALATALLRHFQLLLRLRTKLDQGVSASAVIAGAKPPIFFKRRAHMERQLRTWSSANLMRFASRIQLTILAMRRQGDLAPVIMLRLCVSVAVAARQASVRR